MTSNIENISLKKPSKEEIDQITAEMVAQVQTNYNLRNRVVNDKANKTPRIFIKGVTQKPPRDNKD